MTYNLSQVLLVSENQKSLQDLVNLFWTSRALIESLAEESLNPTKRSKLTHLTETFKTLVVIQATLSHILATIDREQAHGVAEEFGFDLQTYEQALVSLYDTHDISGGMNLSQQFKDFLVGVEKIPAYSQIEAGGLRNFLAYVNALNQLAVRVQ